MGMRVRLKADYDISGFAPEIQVILRALNAYGISLPTTGSDNYVSGEPTIPAGSRMFCVSSNV
jgi:hypothetical protein